MPEERTDTKPFLIARGGPFHELQRRAGLLASDGSGTRARTAAVAAIAWLAPLGLSLMIGRAFGPLETRPFLLDPGAWARFLVGIVLLVAAESRIEAMVWKCLSALLGIPIIAPSSRTGAIAAIQRARIRRDSSFAEVVCIVLAALLSVLVVYNARGQTSSSWAVTIADGHASLTLAGWWSVIVSNTLFWFLLMRIFWRHAIWSLLLADIARLDLRLVASHPDKHAGIGFLAEYPNGYVSSTICLSIVLASAIAHQILHATFTATTFSVITGLWAVLVYLFFGLPLAGLAARVAKLKKETISVAGSRATDYQRQVERSVVGRNIAACSDVEDAGGDAPDPGKLYEAAGKISPLLITRATLVPVFAAGLLPLALVGATQLPFNAILPVLKRLIMI